MRILGLGLILLQALAAAPAHAQGAQPSSSPPSHPVLTQSENARLMRIDEGIFELQVGRTVDLTDQKIMVMITRIERAENQAEAVVTYRTPRGEFSQRVGQRWNLKETFAAPLREYKACYIDIVRVIAPRGQPASATLRMECA